MCRLYGTPCPADAQRVRMNRLRRAAGQMGTLSRFCDLVPELPEFYAPRSLQPPSFPSTCPRFLDTFSFVPLCNSLGHSFPLFDALFVLDLEMLIRASMNLFFFFFLQIFVSTPETMSF